MKTDRPTLIAKLSAELPEGARMDGYYFSFDRTGIGAIDAVLSAIAQAGKAYHSTEFWGDDEAWAPGMPDPGPEPGLSYVGLIQRAANEAAALVREAVSEIAP